MPQQECAANSARIAKLSGLRKGIDAAYGADPAISLENLFPKISGLGSQLPFVHAELGAECEPAPRDFERAPAAKSAAIGPA